MSKDNDSILIVGTGFSGLCMAIQLKKAGIEDFTIVEQASEVGGTWRDNHYPGAACDVQSHLYSYSFEPNPEWSSMFGKQSEIFAYLRKCADKYGLRRHIRFQTRPVKAVWDEARGLWEVDFSKGPSLRVRAIVSGTGGLSQPVYPDIPGLDTFRGPKFHSARWDHGVSIRGKTVGVIGTGASAIQIVPAIAPEVGKLHVFQRSAPWVLPKPDRSITAVEKALFRHVPWTQTLYRGALYLQLEARAIGTVYEPRLMRLLEGPALRYMKSVIKDPVLRAKLTPNYRLGCKRILLANDYYQTFLRPNVDLVTEGIECIVPEGIKTRDGRVVPLDALVMATGFEGAEAKIHFDVVGRHGVTSKTVFPHGPEAYMGVTTRGLPNWFFLMGPNSGLGHTSMVLMIESQVNYVVDALREMRVRGLQSVEVRETVLRSYNQDLQRRLSGTVWATGCSGWHLTQSGKNGSMWPGFTFELKWKTLRFDIENFDTLSKSVSASRAPDYFARVSGPTVLS